VGRGFYRDGGERYGTVRQFRIGVVRMGVVVLGLIWQSRFGVVVRIGRTGWALQYRFRLERFTGLVSSGWAVEEFNG
jgi:hypothetical protein